MPTFNMRNPKASTDTMTITGGNRIQGVKIRIGDGKTPPQAVRATVIRAGDSTPLNPDPGLVNLTFSQDLSDPKVFTINESIASAVVGDDNKVVVYAQYAMTGMPPTSTWSKASSLFKGVVSTMSAPAPMMLRRRPRTRSTVTAGRATHRGRATSKAKKPARSKPRRKSR